MTSPADTADTATLYLRISLDKTGEGLGVERQEEACRALCERMGWEVADLFSDNSVSAMKRKRRAGFEALLESNPQRIVMWSVDRLVRIGPDLERLIDLDVPVHSVAAGPMDLATASGRLQARLLTSVASFESEMKGERQVAAQRQRVARGKPFWAHRPFGYERDGSALREDEAEALRQCYADLLAGTKLAELARRLNGKGLLTPQGNEWTAQTLRPVLKHARNAGIMVYRGEEVGQASWPAIVSEEVFRAALRVFDKRKGGKAGPGPRKNLLTGWADCARCGSTLRVGRKTNKDKSVYQFYLCPEGHVAMERDFLDAYVLRKAIGKLTVSEALQWTGASPEAQVDTDALLAEERAVESRLADLGRLYSEGIIDMSALTEGTKAGRARLAELREAIGAAGQEAAEIVDVELIYQASEDMDSDRLRTLLQRIVASVTVAPRGKGNRLTPSKFVALAFADGTAD